MGGFFWLIFLVGVLCGVTFVIAKFLRSSAADVASLGEKPSPMPPSRLTPPAAAADAVTGDFPPLADAPVASGFGCHSTSGGMVPGKRTASPSGRYYALHSDSGYCEGKLEYGRLWLFGPEGELFSPSKTKRPRSVAVSDSGHLIVADSVNHETLSCWIRIFDRHGALLFEKRHRRNVGGVGISPEGGVALYGTANPGESTRVIDIAKAECVATIEGRGIFDGAEINERERYAWLDSKHADRKKRIDW